VPQQPNLNDCGIYAIHFAATFLNEPEDFIAFMKETAVSGKGIEIRQVQMDWMEIHEKWRTKSISGLRERLKNEIIKSQ
jgi:Ulp1 family protease